MSSIGVILKKRLIGDGNFASSAASTANAAKTITQAAVSGKSHYVSAIEVVITGAATGATPIGFKLSEDVAGTEAVKYQTKFVASAAIGTRIAITFPVPIKIAAGKTCDLVMDAGGNTGCILVGNISGFTM